jgi:hypothetical protein
MNIDKVVSQLESKETLLIFLRDNYPDVLEKWKNRIAGAGTPAATTDADGTNKPRTGFEYDNRDITRY